MKRVVLSLLVAGICVVAARNASASADLGFKSLGGAIGYVSPENLDGTFTFGAIVDHGTIAPNWGLESHVDYWGWSQEAFGTKVSVHDIILGARTKYYFDIANPRVRPFAGGGLAMHFVNVKAEQPGFPSVSDGQTKLGIDLGGGITTNVGPRTNFIAESWYGIVSDVSQFSLRVGMTYNLTAPAPVKHHRSTTSRSHK